MNSTALTAEQAERIAMRLALASKTLSCLLCKHLHRQPNGGYCAKHIGDPNPSSDTYSNTTCPQFSVGLGVRHIPVGDAKVIWPLETQDL